MRVGYVLKRFPRLSETFILNEIRAVERLGVEVAIFSLLPPEGGPSQPGLEDLRATITYPEGNARDVLQGLGGIGFSLLRRPLPTLGALMRVPFQGSLRASWKNLLRAGRAVWWARKERVDFLHAHFANAPTAVALGLHRLTGIPFGFTAHAKDLYLTRPTSLQRALHGAAWIVTCTRAGRDYLETLSGGQPILCLYHGIDLSAFAQVHRRAADPPVLLSVGRLVPKKGYDDLLAAYALLAESGVSFRARIIGSGPERQALEGMAARLGIGERVEFLGALPHPEVLRHLSEARLFVLAPKVLPDGDRDGIPNVLVEAMAAGVPVVTTATSGIPELVEDGVTGRLVPAGDPAALYRALQDGLQGDAETMVPYARERALRGFNVFENTRELVRLWQKKGA